MLMHRPGFSSITFLQKFTPHFKILDPRLELQSAPVILVGDSNEMVTSEIRELFPFPTDFEYTIWLAINISVT